MSEQPDVANLLAQAGAALQRRDGRAALELIAQAEAQAPVHSAPQESDAGGQRGSDERQKSASEANTTEECEAAD